MAGNKELVLQINKELAMDLPERISLEELQHQLAGYVNDLIQHHFEQLISLLYRVDVSESKIKMLLQQQHNQDAANIIAALIIERQLEKIKTRRQFNRRDTNFTDEETW